MSENNSKFKDGETPEPNYWRSFNELYNDKNFIEASHHEFNEGVKEEFNPGTLSGLSRRKFLALLGASAALAGAGCGHRDKGEIIPYNTKPEEILPGNPNYYASTCTACSSGCGILIKTREGRPIKVDGNLLHPVNRGKICAKGQANILNLYDPERLKTPVKKTAGVFNSIEWKDADFAILNELNKAGNKEIAVITHTINSPTALKVADDFIRKFPSARFYSYEFYSSSRNAAWGGEFPLIQWDQAKVIVTLEADLLGTGENKVETVRLYSEGRDVKNLDRFNRLYAVEGNMSLTGMNADYRIRLNPLFISDFISLISENIAVYNKSSVDAFASRHKIKAVKLNHLIEDLNKFRGEAIVYAGDLLPEEVHRAVNNLNNTLGNNKLYRTDSQKVTLHPSADMPSFESLVERMHNNGVASVIHFDSNPVYHLPPGIGYKDALRKVPLVVTLTELENESSEVSDYVLPVHHNFESWGDAKTRTGFYSLQQPVISPLFNTRQKEAVLLNWTGNSPDKFDERTYYTYLTDNWRNNIYSGTGSSADFEQFWSNALHDGVVFTPAEQPQSRNFTESTNLKTVKPENKKYTIVFRESFFMGDGRFANNGWLQELPHPVSKVTWDNYAAISYRTAQELDVITNDLIEIELNGRKQEIPVLVQPGSADNCITIELGYGRYKTGIVGMGVGFNFNTMLGKNGGWLYTTDSVRKAGGSHKLASTQEHHIFDDDLTKNEIKKRNIVKEGTLKKYREDRNFLREHKEHPTVLGTHLHEMYSGIKWGMAIDMNKCLGCGECIVACNVENNIPVVGRDQVLVSREMQWLRVDRYYSGSPDDPEVLSQVMLCQHCDHAPCENVCPVVATTHSIDGLNQMAYNRCVGTRYCSNNCPYKVRRFNFFNFRDHFRDGYQENNVISLVHNPEVTVRSRGVMEKCTFCIQRIMKAREDAITYNRPLKGTDVTTACQDACISNAITFGDMNDKNSEYAKTREHELGYYVLEDINTRPNVTYIAKLRNKEEDAL